MTIDISARLRLTLVITVVVLVCEIAISSCGYNIFDSNNDISDDMEESIEHGVFVAQYASPENPYHWGDSIGLHVKNAWLEHQWRYGKTFSDIIVKDGYQFIVQAEESDLSDYAFKWTIGVDSRAYFMSNGPDGLVLRIDSLPVGNGSEWLVQKGDDLRDSVPENVIGRLRLDPKP